MPLTALAVLQAISSLGRRLHLACLKHVFSQFEKVHNLMSRIACQELYMRCHRQLAGQVQSCTAAAVMLASLPQTMQPSKYRTP